MLNYFEFLFNSDGSLKPRVAPVVNYLKDSNSFVLKYSVPGYHSPRQYFKFSSIPNQFPNEFVAFIFQTFSITDSFLFRHPHNKVPKVKHSIVNAYFNISPTPKSFSQEDIDIATYNLNLAIKLGKSHHSLFFFDSYLEAYKILHPEISRYSKSIVKSILTEFNKLISS